MILPIKRTDIEQKQVGDELYLFLPAGQSLTVLNATAMMIWSLCDGNHDQHQMLEALHITFPNVDSATLDKDIATCLAEFRDKKLLTE